MRSHYDPNQPRIPRGNHGGGRWSDGSAPEPISQHYSEEDRQPDKLNSKLAFSSPQRPPGKAGGVAALFAVFSALNTLSRRAVLDFNALDLVVNADGTAFERVEIMDRAQAEKLCDGLENIQKIVDEAARDVQEKRPDLFVRETKESDREARQKENKDKGSEYGRLVHEKVKEAVKSLKDPNVKTENPETENAKFEAEQSFEAKGTRPPSRGNEKPAEEIPQENRQPRMVKLDVFKQPQPKLVCIVEVKTGKDDMPPRTMVDYGLAARKAFKEVERVIVTQARPSWEYTRPRPDERQFWLRRMLDYRSHDRD